LGVKEQGDLDLAEQLQVFGMRFLLAIHHGDVDVVHLVRREPRHEWQRSVDRIRQGGQALGM